MKMSQRIPAIALLLTLLAINALHGQSLWHTALATPEQRVVSFEARVTATTDHPQRCTGFRWNESLIKWDTTSQTLFSYALTGDLLVQTNSIWTLSGYELDTRVSHTYDTQGFETLTLGESWNDTTWKPTYRFLRTFDPFGNVTQSIGQAWNGIAWDTSSGYRATFTYHNTDQIASMIQESYTVGTGWFPDYKTEYSFDLQDRWDTIAGYSANQSSWVPDLRLVGIGWHDFAKLQPDSGRYEKYNTGWYDFQRFNATYSQNDNQVWIYQKFATTWDDSDKFIFQYDAQANEVRNEAYRWIGAWLQTDGLLTHYTYGTGGEKLEVWQELFDGYIYRYDNRQLYDDFFTAQATPIANSLRVTLFPNPVSGTNPLQFLISLEKPEKIKLEIFDLQGRLRLEANANASHQALLTIPLPQAMENGTYVYRIVTNQGFATGKILLQR
jgi:hypothetical protein